MKITLIFNCIRCIENSSYSASSCCVRSHGELCIFVYSRVKQVTHHKIVRLILALISLLVNKFGKRYNYSVVTYGSTIGIGVL